MSSKIEWTDETWNPITGCSRISPGCLNCYAERQALRRLHAYETGLPWNLANARENVVLHPDRLEIPLRWEKPRKIFVCSVSDLFHEEVPDDFIAQVWGRMASEARHTFQILTKRSERMKGLLTNPSFKEEVEHEFACNTFGIIIPLKWPLPNIWGGVSAEDQPNYDNRVVELLETPFVIRFVSLEPLLGPIILDDGPAGGGHTALSVEIDHPEDTKLDWVIVGGESGPRARPMDPRWVRSIRDQCKAADIPFFFKQWGEWKPVGAWGKAPEFARVGKKAAGRELDGVLYDAMPRMRAE